MATNKSKSMDKMPARKMPKGFKMELKATPKATSKAKPMTEAQKQKKAMDDLMKKRKAVSKKTGSWPNYNTN
jgi:hypothetical protein